MADHYCVLAFYVFTEIKEPHAEVIKHKQFFEGKEITSRIYISEEGMNGQMGASVEDAESYMSWLKSDPRFSAISFKIHRHHEQPFPRADVKYRKQLVALDRKVDASKTAPHLSPQEWKEMLEKKEENTLLIDVRNDYESAIGHFEGAVLPPLKTFREFPHYVEKLKSEVNPKETKIMMYCTGGIRCELYSVLFKEAGFESVYQLEGGVINYGLTVGSEHWKGKLFVFDDRLAVPIAEGQEASPIADCHFCSQPCDTYLNCSNMDCNDLFLACKECRQAMKGCCSHECKDQGALRPCPYEETPKPFRRLPFSEKMKCRIK